MMTINWPEVREAALVFGEVVWKALAIGTAAGVLLLIPFAYLIAHITPPQ